MSPIFNNEFLFILIYVVFRIFEAHEDLLVSEACRVSRIIHHPPLQNYIFTRQSDVSYNVCSLPVIISTQSPQDFI